MDADSQVVHPPPRREHYQDGPVDGQMLKQLAEAGLTWLKTNQQVVNALNVFPVPDGDTGTNMVLTMQAAWGEVASLSEKNVGKVAHALAHGSLMGARGNSGVILSQLWRGFARALDSQPTMNAADMVRAFAMGRDTAYKGVVRPVEGTILTVAKDCAAAAERALPQTQNPFDLLDLVVAEANNSVNRTPDLLPVLKNAGVVDSGGKGLFFILEGMMRFVYSQPLDVAATAVQPLSAMNLENTLETIEPGQDFEVVVDFRPHAPLVLDNFYTELEKIGTSIQIGEGEGMYRLHIHVPTEKRYVPIDYTMSLGTISKVTMENLIAQMEEIEKSSNQPILEVPPIEPGQIAVIAVSPGIGISRVFASLGAAAIVEGGQTMNPSTNDLVQAFENLPTEQIIILPNNKNIILAAQTASQLSKKKIAVIPTRTVPQGLAAMLRLVPQGQFDQVVTEMTEAITDSETGEITTAIRSVNIDGVDVEKGEFIGLHNGKLVTSASTLEETCLDLLEKAGAHDKELITLFYGDNISLDEVERIKGLILDKFTDQEVELQQGGQPHYHFIISIE